MEEIVISLRNIQKEYTDTLLYYRDMNFLSNKSYIMLGPSGCGKTTLLKMIKELEKPSKGQIDIKGSVGFMEQSPLFLDDFSVMDNLNLICKNKNLIRDSIKKVHLEKKVNAKLKTLSSGEKQRVSIVRSILDNKKIMLYDEPTASLNHDLAILIVEQLILTHKKSKNTLIVVTHDEELKEQFDVVLDYRDYMWED